MRSVKTMTMKELKAEYNAIHKRGMDLRDTRHYRYALPSLLMKGSILLREGKIWRVVRVNRVSVTVQPLYCASTQGKNRRVYARPRPYRLTNDEITSYSIMPHELAVEAMCANRRFVKLSNEILSRKHKQLARRFTKMKRGL